MSNFENNNEAVESPGGHEEGLRLIRGSEVRVQRSNGDIDEGWTITGFDQQTGYAIVQKPNEDGVMMTKSVSRDKLEALNTPEQLENEPITEIRGESRENLDVVIEKQQEVAVENIKQLDKDGEDLQEALTAAAAAGVEDDDLEDLREMYRKYNQRKKITDRIKGSLTGLAVGDVIGLTISTSLALLAHKYPGIEDIVREIGSAVRSVGIEPYQLGAGNSVGLGYMSLILGPMAGGALAGLSNRVNRFLKP